MQKNLQKEILITSFTNFTFLQLSSIQTTIAFYILTFKLTIMNKWIQEVQLSFFKFIIMSATKNFCSNQTEVKDFNRHV